MKDLAEGLGNKIKYVVEEKDSARNHGSGLLDVFATPALIALMERTAMELVQPYLPDGFGTVGSMVNTKHIKASKIGTEVISTATLVTIDSRRLEFELKVEENDTLIGYGIHERFIIDEEKFINKLG